MMSDAMHPEVREVLDAFGVPPPPPVPPESWREDGKSRLEALLGYVPSYPAWVEGHEDVVPWRRGCSLAIHSLGDSVSRDRERYSIVGHEGYAGYVAGHRNTIAEKQRTHVEKSRVLMVTNKGSTIDGVRGGRDHMRVHGNAELKFRSRSVILGYGTAERHYSGGIQKMAPMEGVIAGGAHVRAFGGPAASLSALASGDVYGGSARAAATRVRMAILHYRAASAAAWTYVAYVRAAQFIIEPMVSVPQSSSPKSQIARKLMRLMKVVRVARMLCPGIDIAVGVATAVPLAIYGIAMLIKSKIVGPNPIPPAGPPRVLNRIGATELSCFGSMMYM